MSTIYETEASSTSSCLAIFFIDLSKDLSSFQNLITRVKYIESLTLYVQDIAGDSLLLIQNTGTENEMISKFRMAY